MNNNHPPIPADWIAHSGVIAAGNGYRTHVKTVLHKASAGSYHPFVLHTAYEYNGAWSYEQGSYCMTKEEGMEGFNARMARMVAK
jgi:hypothetical protein